MRGVILAGGKGSRLGELTTAINKHLLPVGDCPMIAHPMKKLVGIGIRDILIITSADALRPIATIYGSGDRYNCRLTYRVQDEAGGIAQALLLAEDFVGISKCCVLLGDNIFHDPIPMLTLQVPDARAWVVLKQVHDPLRYGVATIDLINKRVTAINEKPLYPDSDLAVTGIYTYPYSVFNVIRTLKPSSRGELEITDVNNHYLCTGQLDYCILPGWWTDAGTHESLAYANKMIREQPPTY